LNLRGRVFDTAKDILVSNSTYFSLLLSSPSFELGANEEFFIDRNSHRFDRIFEYMSTGVLSTEGLNSYDKDCLYDNLNYFMIPHTREWDYSKISNIETLRLDKIVQLKDVRLCGTNNEDYTIAVYNMDTNRIDMTLEGHTDTVNAIIRVDDGSICSCSDDCTIKVWNVKSGQCVVNLFGHTGCVNCVLLLANGRLCSGSDDMTLRVWSRSSGACELSVDTEESVICIAQLRDGRICSGGDNGDIRIWNLNARLCEMTLDGLGLKINHIAVIDESRICSCANNTTTIRVWVTDAGVCERSLEGHEGWVNYFVLLLDGRICSVSDDGIVKIWNTDTGVCDFSSHGFDYGLLRVIQLHDGRLLVTDCDEQAFIVGA
jgi:WD40 repeat protein